VPILASHDSVQGCSSVTASHSTGHDCSNAACASGWQTPV
jgi:hypothetical protein